MMKPLGRQGAVDGFGDRGSPEGAIRVQRIQAVDRAIELLKAVAGAEQPPTAAELAHHCGLNRTTAWRLLTTLENHGLVERDAAQRYGIGYGTIALGQSPSGSGALVRLARPALEQLAEETGDTVTLSIPRHSGVVAVDQIDPPNATLLLNYLSKPLPLHATSNGKVVLASLSEPELDGILAQPLTKCTPATVTHRARLLEIIADVRRDGYAVTVGELDVGVNGVSVGVEDESGALIATLSLSGTDHRLPAAALPGRVPALQRAARVIQERLGDQR